MAKLATEIDFNPELFNNIYWHLEEAFNNTDIRYIWAYGGSSASKTYSVVQLIIVDMLRGNDNSTLILRKFAVDIKDSIYADFKNIINAWGLQDYFIIQQNFILCSTGSFVRFRGLDDSEKVKGITGFKRVVLEEISQFEEVDYKQIKKRLRGRIGQQIICLFNPISEEHWIKTKVFDEEILEEVKTNITGKWLNVKEGKKSNTVILKVTYLDNKYIVGPYFVDQHVIDDFEKDKETDFAYYQIYGLGNWGKLRTGGEFWKDFNPNIHVKINRNVGGYPELYRQDLAIFTTWDKNVNPYLTCLVWQIEIIGEVKKVWQIDEICLEDPRNRVKHVCAEFKKRYPPSVVQGLFVFGDRTAIQEDTMKEKGENFFTDILKEWIDYDPTLKVQSVNPSVAQSGNFVNKCYAVNYEGIEITIGDNCKKSINDYSYALEDSDGTLKKSKKTNPVTKVTYEEFGHPSDAKRYLITHAFAEEYSKYKSSGRSFTPLIGGTKHSKRF